MKSKHTSDKRTHNHQPPPRALIYFVAMMLSCLVAIILFVYALLSIKVSALDLDMDSLVSSVTDESAIATAVVLREDIPTSTDVPLNDEQTMTEIPFAAVPAETQTSVITEAVPAILSTDTVVFAPSDYERYIRSVSTGSEEVGRKLTDAEIQHENEKFKAKFGTPIFSDAVPQESLDELLVSKFNKDATGFSNVAGTTGNTLQTTWQLYSYSDMNLLLQLYCEATKKSTDFNSINLRFIYPINLMDKDNFCLRDLVIFLSVWAPQIDKTATREQLPTNSYRLSLELPITNTYFSSLNTDKYDNLFLHRSFSFLQYIQLSSDFNISFGPIHSESSIDTLAISDGGFYTSGRDDTYRAETFYLFDDTLKEIRKKFTFSDTKDAAAAYTALETEYASFCSQILLEDNTIYLDLSKSTFAWLSGIRYPTACSLVSHLITPHITFYDRSSLTWKQKIEYNAEMASKDEYYAEDPGSITIRSIILLAFALTILSIVVILVRQIIIQNKLKSVNSSEDSPGNERDMNTPIPPENHL